MFQNNASRQLSNQRKLFVDNMVSWIWSNGNPCKLFSWNIHFIREDLIVSYAVNLNLSKYFLQFFLKWCRTDQKWRRCHERPWQGAAGAGTGSQSSRSSSPQSSGWASPWSFNRTHTIYGTRYKIMESMNKTTCV